MDILVRAFRSFIFSNIFIALCAVLMTWQTMFLFDVPGLHNGTLRMDLLAFTFFATVCSYSFHWMLSAGSPTSSRSIWMAGNRFAHPLLLVTGIIGTLWFGLRLREHWPSLMAIAFITFLYSAPKIPHPLFRMLRRIAIGKTLFLAIVWTAVTALLPIVIPGISWEPKHTVFFLNRFFLIYAICILFDIRDRDYDQQVGIRSLITWLKPSQVRLLFRLSLLLFYISGLLMLAFGQSVPYLAVLLLPGVICGLLYKKAVSDFSDLFYYFVLDGLMAASALVFLVLDAISG